MVELRTIDSAAPLRLRDIFERSCWQHVVLLTYTFDLPFFESYLLPLLVRNGTRHITVVADAVWLTEQLPGWIDANLVREAGRRYALFGVRVPGTFHPKLIVGIGQQGGTILLGSGNISEFGLATGGELFHLVEWSEGTPPPVAHEVWRLCRSLTSRLQVDQLFGIRLDAIAQDAHTITLSGSGSNQILANLDEPIIDQLVRQVHGEQVDELLLWSPFSDRKLEALAVLVERLEPRRVQLALQPGISGFDGDRLRSLIGQFKEVDWAFPRLFAQFVQPPAPQPMIHAKGIIIRLASGEELLLAGSPNLSRPALLATAGEGNVELAMVTRGYQLSAALFDPDGPIILMEDVDLDAVRWHPEPTAPRESSHHGSVQLLGAHWNGKFLDLSIHGDLPQETAARVVAQDPQVAPLSIQIASDEADPKLVSLNLVEAAGGFVPLSVTLRWSDGQSGPVIVSDLPSLQASSGEDKRTAATLPAIDWGDDDELNAILDALAEIAITTVFDIGRIVRGDPTATTAEEADEVEGTAPPIDLSQIDFEWITQHPRARANDAVTTPGYVPSRMQLLLDEVVQQFDWLQQRRLRLLTPEDPGDPEAPEPPKERPRWSVSARTQVRWRNRLRRFVLGARDPRFWDLAGPDWMGQNYILVLELLRRLWERAADPKVAILPRADIGRIGLDFLSAFWGDDQEQGYWWTLSEDDREEVGIRLLDLHGDALTLAMADRFLDLPGAAGADAPFVVAGFVRAVEALGFLNAVSEDDALDYLGDLERLPGPLLKRITGTPGHFTWQRFCGGLTARYSLQKATVRKGERRVNDVPVDVLNVQASVAVQDHPNAMEIFQRWVETVIDQDPGRRKFHLTWQINAQPGEDLLYWDQVACEFVWQRRITAQSRRTIETSQVMLADLKRISLMDLEYEDLASQPFENQAFAR